MNLGQNKVILPTPQSHRRLWFTSIVTLFIFATSVSAYFLVKHSQDIRKSASEPYGSNCTCIYNSSCSVVNMKPCEGQCNPTCNYPATCCQPITQDFCTQGERYCVDANRIATCKSDRSGYTITNCASGSSCNSQQKLCIANPTPTPISGTNPTLSCSTNGGQCMSVSCASVYMQSIAGSCSNASYNCCKTIQQFACNAGAKECVNSTTRRYCNSERTAWITVSCPNGSTCSDGTCVFPCQGTCYANSSCSVIGKYQAVGQCSNSSAICCQDTPASCQGSCYAGSSCSVLGKLAEAGNCPGTNTVCCKEASTPTCEGTCYTNTSCTAIGKAPASGTCRYSTSVCCQEASTTTSSCEGDCYYSTSCTAIDRVPASGTCKWDNFVCCEVNTLTALANPGLKAKGEHCSNSEECITGLCSNVYINNVGDVVWLLNSLCVPSLAEQDKSVVQQHQKELVYGAAGAGFTTTLVTGIYTIPSIIGLTGGNLALLPTAAYSYATATLATAPAWAQTALSFGTVATGWAGVFGGQKACADDPNSNACAAFVAGLMINPAGITELEDMTKSLVNKAGNSVNNYLTQKINQTFDNMDSWGYGYQAVDSEVTDYLFPEKRVLLFDQMDGKAYSPAVENVSSLAQSYIDQGMDPYLAIAQATNETMPPYWHQTNTAGTPVNVPAGSARSLEELVSCEGAVCRHYAQLALPVSNNMGYDTDFNSFSMLVDTPEGPVPARHAVNLVKNLDGTFGVIDPTNPNLTRNNIIDYINNIESLGWHPTSDFGSATVKDYTFQVIH